MLKFAFMSLLGEEHPLASLCIVSFMPKNSGPYCWKRDGGRKLCLVDEASKVNGTKVILI